MRSLVPCTHNKKINSIRKTRRDQLSALQSQPAIRQQSEVPARGRRRQLRARKSLQPATSQQLRINPQKGKRPQTSYTAYQAQKAKKSATQAARETAKATNERQTTKTTNTGQVNGGGKPNQTKTATGAGQNAAKRKFGQGKPVAAHHFNLSKQPNTAKAPPVKFQQGQTYSRQPKLARSTVHSVPQLQFTMA